jgi:hypothetical protein
MMGLITSGVQILYIICLLAHGGFIWYQTYKDLKRRKQIDSNIEAMTKQAIMIVRGVEQDIQQKATLQ